MLAVEAGLPDHNLSRNGVLSPDTAESIGHAVHGNSQQGKFLTSGVPTKAEVDEFSVGVADKNRIKDERRKELDDEAKRRKRRPFVIFAVVIAALLLVSAGVYYWLSGRDIVSTTDAYTDGIAVTIAPKVAGYVTELSITDNQRVRAGDMLLKIDDRDYRVAQAQAEAALRIAEAQLENARGNMEIAQKTFPSKLASAKAQGEIALANQAKALADLRRQRTVDPRGTEQSSVDAAAATARVTTATVNDIQAQLEIARLVPQNINLAQVQVQQMEAQVAQAKAQLDQAKLNLTYTTLRAPQDGWVTKRNVELGTYVQVGQSLFSLVSPNVWVTANFKEDELDRMRPGDRVVISIDAYPGLKLGGHVDSLQMGTGGRFTAFPPENATGNYIKIVQRLPVKILIDSGVNPGIPLPLNLSVTPRVTLSANTGAR